MIMANVYDQFVDPPAPQTAAVPNVYDQFDNPAASPASPTFTQRLLSNIVLGAKAISDAQNTSFSDMGRILGNAATFNLADPVAAWAASKTGIGGPDTVAGQRAATQAARTAAGPIGSTALDVAGYMAGPGQALGPLVRLVPGSGIVSRVGSGVLEGAGSGAGYSAGKDLGDPNADMFSDAALGAGGGAIAGALAAPIASTVEAGANAIGRKMAPAIPTTDALKATKDALYGATQHYTYDPTDVSALAKDIVDAGRNANMSKLGTPGAHGFFNGFAKQAINANAPVSMQELRDIADRANVVVGAPYAKIFNDKLDNFFENTDPINATATDASNALDAANKANQSYKNSALLDQWQRDAGTTNGQSVPAQAGAYIRSGDANRYLGGPGDPRYDAMQALDASGENLGAMIDRYSYGVGHHFLGPLAVGAATAGAGHLGVIHSPLEYMAAMGIGTPVASAVGSALSGAQTGPAIDAARQS